MCSVVVCCCVLLCVGLCVVGVGPAGPPTHHPAPDRTTFRSFFPSPATFFFLSRSGLQTPPKCNVTTPKREKKQRKLWRRGEKKNAKICALHPSGPHPSTMIHTRSRKDWLNMDWPKMDWQIGLAQIGQIRMARVQACLHNCHSAPPYACCKPSGSVEMHTSSRNAINSFGESLVNRAQTCVLSQGKQKGPLRPLRPVQCGARCRRHSPTDT